MLKTMLTPLAPVFAALAASFLQQAWWLRGIEGAAFGAIAFVFIPMLINWGSSQSKVVVTLRLDCAADFLPTILPAQGRVVAIQLRTIWRAWPSHWMAAKHPRLQMRGAKYWNR
jgi:hypothetical protein